MFIDVHGITLGYDDVGEGLAVVLLHAFPLHRAMWATTRKALAHDYRVITPDARGFGESSGADSATMDDLADDLIGLLDALGIQPAVVGGLSLGGYVALNLVGRYPERVRGLILADTRAAADTAEGVLNRRTLADQALNEGARSIADRTLPKMLSAHAAPDVVTALRAMIESAVPQAIAITSHGMAARADSTPLLAAMTLPTLIVVGSDDSITPVADSLVLHKAIPNASLAIIPDAGHVSVLEQPQAFNRALAVFLASLDDA